MIEKRLFCGIITLYLSVFTDDGSRPYIDNGLISSSDSQISQIIFNQISVFKAASRVKSKSTFALDPDGYPVILLQKLCSILAGPLSLFYNSFMSIGQVPDAWKKAAVTPVYKSGPSSNPANYRPISQTIIFL